MNVKKKEKLSEFEKIILIMTTTNRDEALKLAEGDEIMEKYIEEAKRVEKNDNYLREAYDHELSGKIAEHEAGFEEGHISGFEEGHTSGFEEGEKKKALDIAKELLKLDVDLEKIQKSTKLSLDEIQKISDDLKH